MEEQGSIVLQKKIILAVFTFIFTITSVLNVMTNQMNSSKFVAVASDNEIKVSSNINFEEIEDDIILIEQIAYATVKTIEETTNEISADEEMPIELISRIEKSEDKVSRKGNREEIIEKKTEEVKTPEVKYVSYRDLAENNPPTEYKDVIEATATAYCLCQKCCGKTPSHPYYGYTASGIKIVPGTGIKVIAVDPNVIPLGTKVYVDGLNGAWDYGYAVAADTGSAIKNLKIDLYMDTHSEALSWGRRSVNIYVVE